ncbi:RodZ domain-containing protein [Streptomyces griseus]|uniref:RodZ domain-containing protein n=1 Tax=Streptomyces griseus TaxID=1911 RepID=UPI00131C1EC4|nr:RodZ domain-containing protein [Streptomyces griseus]
MGPGTGLPERIGSYAVERELGAGGMGRVYLARSRGGRPVAVKVVRPELAGDPHFRERFRAEVAAARKVGGFHTAPVVDADPDAPAPWLATAFVPGPTLNGLLAEHCPMDEGELRLLGAALAEALQAIHACGLVHRDLKPGNIIMAGDGPRVLDFGIARAVESTRLTSTGAAFGTPGFLAPEQARGSEVDGAADVFALGAVLVAAAGGSAFGDGTPVALMYRSVHEPADLSALPEGLRPVVAACLAKEPAARPTPARLLDLLAPVSAPVPVETPAPVPRVPTLPAPVGAPRTPTVPVPVAPVPRRARPPLRAVVAAAVAVAVLGAGGTYLLTREDDRRAGPSTAAPRADRTTGAAGASSPAPSTAASSSATATSSPELPAATGKGVPGGVTVVAAVPRERSWLSARSSDGRVLFDGVLQAGESRTFTDEEEIRLVLGNAGAFRLVVNGEPYPGEFEDAQVERLTFTP